MNRFDEKYEIRMANLDEIDDVMHFIDTHWRKGHILATNRTFFEYEHIIDGQVNFLIAKDKETGEIHGILGFLPASKNREKYDIWNVMWKVLEGTALPMLGVELKKRLFQMTNARADLGVGSNPKTALPLLRIIMRNQTGKMRHYYCLADRENYKIAVVKHKENFTGNRDCHVSMVRYTTIDEVRANYDFSINEDMIPYKDDWYMERRFFLHPIYRYEVYGLCEQDNSVKALLVCRVQECNGAKALRIVDYIGKQELFAGISVFLEDKLKEFEYIDFYFYGFDEKYVRAAGMIEVCEEDTNVIPDYFYPYVAKNIDIWVTSSCENCMFFKADGDQDRPN